MDRRPALWAGLLLIGAGSLAILMTWSGGGRFSNSVGTSTPEPIVPTRTPAAAAEEALVTETEADASPGRSSTTAGVTEHPAERIAYEGHSRWCATVSAGPISAYETEPFHLGWYLDWAAKLNPPRPGGAEYAQMVRLKGGRLEPDKASIAEIARATRGALWLIGNEPDVKWQDNVEPAVYARLYHEAYSAIKQADPTARVAVGGITQPTPLRLRYVGQVLAFYEERFGVEMPMDVWHVHNFILREERGAWGVDIPPGLPDQQGALYEIDDGDDMDIFRRQIVDFRRWMVERGYQSKPLVVSEYGILMPEEYGFPPERVVAFLTGTFDFFLTAADRMLGYPEDDYRLVQRWCWYSLNAPDSGYPTGRLMDPETGKVTAVGEGWVEFVESVVLQRGE